jgi:hypothetical protein
MSANKNNQNMPSKFYCEDCQYTCSKKSCWSQHLMTSKHQKANSKLTEANEKYSCEHCNIYFKHQSSYCRHKKKCNVQSVIEPTDESIDKDQLILMLINQNSELIKEISEFKNMMMEVIKNGTHNTTHTNSHNKTFNLQFFLNETCKDAMNIMDFVDSIKLQLSDLENV